MGSDQIYPAPVQSFASAIVMASIFFVGGMLNLLQLKRTGFKLYMEAALTGFLPCIAYAIAAASVVKGSSNANETLVFTFFSNSGYSIAIGIGILMMGVWYKNARAEVTPPKPHLWRLATILLFVTMITLGPVLGLISAIFAYVVATPVLMSVASYLRYVSAVTMMAVASITTCLSFGSWLYIIIVHRKSHSLHNSCDSKAWDKRCSNGLDINGQPGTAIDIEADVAGSSGAISRHGTSCSDLAPPAHERDPDSLVWVLGLASLLLVWSGGFRMAMTFNHPTLKNEEHLIYTVQMLPLVLNVYLWACGPLLAKAALGSSYNAWCEMQLSNSSKVGSCQDPNEDKQSSHAALTELTAGQLSSKEGQAAETAEQQSRSQTGSQSGSSIAVTVTVVKDA